MRRCFYHTDLGENAVFHNFAIQIALIQYSGRSKHAWAFSETVKKIPKAPIRLAGTHDQRVPLVRKVTGMSSLPVKTG